MRTETIASVAIGALTAAVVGGMSSPVTGVISGIVAMLFTAWLFDRKGGNGRG